MLQLLQKTVWRFLKKLKVELSYDPAIQLWIYTKRDESRDKNGYLPTDVHRHITHNSKKMEAAQVSLPQ